MPAPIAEIFHRLRDEELPLGVDDYLEVFEAMQAGFGVRSREDLATTLQILWAKTEEDIFLVREILERSLPHKFTPADLQRLARRDPGPGDGGRRPDEREPPPDASQEAPPDEAESATEAPQPDTRPDPIAYRYGHASRAELGLRLSTGRAVEMDNRLDLVGHYPITRRQMKNVWRRYRRMRRSGPAVELDAEATLQRVYRRGVMDRVVKIPRRGNAARMLLLLDEGGSMTPFRKVVGSLEESARMAGLTRVDVRYFHDAAEEFVYRDRTLNDPIRLELAVRPFTDAGVLVVGDAGAARGRTDEARLSRTLAGLQRIRRATQRVAWVNPVPASRWSGSTAELIQQSGRVSMFPLDRDGLSRAIDVLRGRAEE